MVYVLRRWGDVGISPAPVLWVMEEANKVSVSLLKLIPGMRERTTVVSGWDFVNFDVLRQHGCGLFGKGKTPRGVPVYTGHRPVLSAMITCSAAPWCRTAHCIDGTRMAQAPTRPGGLHVTLDHLV